MTKTIVLAGGCFWGMQELFRVRPGVVATDVGYTGGDNDNPTYHNHPGHAEALRISYDETVTSYADLLTYFFKIHDPTTLNRQGNDIGSSYRSAIFVADDEEARHAKEAIDLAQNNWADPIVTAIEPLGEYYLAEDEHRDYLQKNPGGYTCHFEREF